MYSQIKMISESSPRPSPALICLPGTRSSGRDQREAEVETAIRARLCPMERGSAYLEGGRGLVPWCRCATRRAAFDQYCVERLFCISQTGRGARDALRVSCVNAGDRRGCVKEAEEETGGGRSGSAEAFKGVVVARRTGREEEEEGGEGRKDSDVPRVPCVQLK
ncbi:hypothetical protein E2C01_020491 [Portunus trituberculatus]|uniref:Uncharacterized protein n=1 Tax=Portunus trituberculatus TaxID=210409 RepID=A0A5B7E270_PORTR|nr:hypothetical protein [Portunus trituberculatus]